MKIWPILTSSFPGITTSVNHPDSSPTISILASSVKTNSEHSSNHTEPLNQKYETKIHKRNITRLKLVTRFAMFGRSRKKFAFDPRRLPEEIANYPELFSYVHNLVQFKQSSLQLIAHKIEVSVKGESPQIPPTNWVTYEFDRQIRKQNKRRRNIRDRFIPSSSHITKIEYIGSTAVKVDQQNVIPDQEL